ncbi:hypothetical protein C874_05200 [Elizabethkingia anophelis 502]|nr:hypothetical protein C874_05200 [Elizabethkingia anophelis 502]
MLKQFKSIENVKKLSASPVFSEFFLLKNEYLVFKNKLL